MAITYGVIETAKFEGKLEGKLKNVESTVCNACKNNLDVALISKIAVLTEQEVITIIKNSNLI